MCLTYAPSLKTESIINNYKVARERERERGGGVERGRERKRERGRGSGRGVKI